MQFQELSPEPVSHHDSLNPTLWDRVNLRPEVRQKLLSIAQNFVEFINIPNLNLKDITISGSNASFGYNQHSDLDLHLVCIIPEYHKDLPELFTAKKNQYNFTYNIKIRDIPVELYVQDAKQQHHSAGIYSVLDDQWLSEPNNTAPKTNPKEIKSKARNYASKINQAMRSNDLNTCKETMEELRRLRKAGLERNGEDSVENLAFKLLRSRDQIDKLRKHIDKLTSAELSLKERQ
jgi:hypothetical protein